MDAQNHKVLITVNMKSIKELPANVDDFEMYSQIITGKKKEVTDWTRERFKLPAHTTWNVEFGEATIVDMVYVETQGPVLVNILDETPVGFGYGGYGEGGFGGLGSALVGFTVNTMFLAEGKYQGLQMTNNSGTAIVVDLFAAVYTV